MSFCVTVFCVAVFGDGSSQLICSLDLTSPRVVTSVVSISAYAISTDTLLDHTKSTQANQYP